MIQLKPGILPASLNAPSRSTTCGKHTAEKKTNAGVRFERVFSDAAVAPFDQIEWERRTAEINDDSGKVRKTGARSRPKLRSQNISTAISRMARIRTKADEKCQCGN